jgi:transcriptional regulator with XRE-family HTH domain
MFDIKKFGAYISKLRKQIDMTQSELADKLTVSRQSVSMYENGDTFPDISVLIDMSKIFKVTIEDMIYAGEPTKVEAILLTSDIKQSEIPQEIFNNNIALDIVNIAPLLKPSILDKIAQGFGKHGIDISQLVSLAEYMNDDSFLTLMENATFDTLDRNLLEKFLPFLNEQSKNTIFEKIIDGDLDYHYLEILLPYAEYLISRVEAAVVYGVLDVDALRILREL